MRRNVLFLPIVLVAAGYSQTASPESFLGDWHAIGVADDLKRVVIERDGANLTVRMWSQCRPTDCDWGRAPVFISAGGASVAATFSRSYSEFREEFALLADGNLQVTTIQTGSARSLKVTNLTKGENASAGSPAPVVPAPSKPEVLERDSPVNLAALPLAPRIEAVGRTWTIPALSYGPNYWSVLRITNPARTSRPVKLDIYQENGNRLGLKPSFELPPEETLEVVITPKQVEVYRRSSQSPGDLNGPRNLESILVGALSPAGTAWARIVQGNERNSPDLAVRAFVEILEGDVISDFEREAEEPSAVPRWTLRKSEVQGEQIYFLNVSDDPTMVTFCAANKVERNPCEKKESSPNRFSLKAHQFLLIQVKPFPERYFIVESSRAGKAILAKLRRAKGSSKVFSSESSISFEK